ncbi:MAG: hypothetical protein AAF998_18415 [Bacteroidota bacterium]
MPYLATPSNNRVILNFAGTKKRIGYYLQVGPLRYSFNTATTNKGEAEKLKAFRENMGAREKIAKVQVGDTTVYVNFTAGWGDDSLGETEPEKIPTYKTFNGVRYKRVYDADGKKDANFYADKYRKGNVLGGGGKARVIQLNGRWFVFGSPGKSSQ